jgi:alkanesulfonate monooxygenase SsuD/methylene tetrahydromethanopterin reductase-like flavin-dependent oxidoreductase (luciferase family)
MYTTWGGDSAAVRHTFEVLRGYCEEIGRPADDIVRGNHVTMFPARDERDLAAKQKRYTWFRSTPPLIGIKEYAAGSQYLIFDLVDRHDPETLAFFAEAVVPAVRDL